MAGTEAKREIEAARIELQDWRAYIIASSDTDHEIVLETDIWADGQIRTERLRMPTFRMKPLAEILRLMIEVYYR